MRTELRPILFFLIAAACSHPTIKQGNGDGGNCAAGTELCGCLPGNACTGDLVCGSNICVRVGPGTGGSGGSPGDDAAAGGSGGTVGSGTGGSGGAPGGTNLITNGDFSQGEMFWKYILNNGGTDNHMIRNGQFCATIGNQSVTIGWDPTPAMLMLAAGTHYRLSYTASASNPVTFNAKVGHAVDPFTTDFEMDNVPISTNLTSHNHDFTPGNPDDRTGIAFIIQGPGNGTSDVCIDDVSLTAN